MTTPRNTTKKNVEKAPSRKVISARGETVDFDLLKIKSQINESSPKTIEVVARERFINKRRRRGGTNRKIDEMLAQQADATRYAEEAIKTQQDQKDQETDVIEIVAAQEPVIQEALTEDTKPQKFNRKLNK